MRAVFLDRDGTLNISPDEHHYVTAVEDFVWIPGARQAIRRLGAKMPLFIISNQRGVGRGLVTVETVKAIEARIQAELAPARIEGFYYCFHDPEQGQRCNCRKPAPGLLEQAAVDHAVDLSRSWMVGDLPTDLQAGRAVGCQTIQVLPERPWSTIADEILADYENVAASAA